VLRSRDDFSRERRWTLRNLLGLFGSKRFERTGTTQLTDFDHWQAQDDLEYRSSGGLFSGRTQETLAAGWAVVGGTPQSGSSSADYVLPGLFSGLPGTYDLRDTGASDPRTGVSVLASKPVAGAQLAAGPGGRLAAFDARPPGGNISALARAEVFFERAEGRADGREEHGSTFGPYWRVRLVPAVAADRLYAAGQQEGVVLP
jgi:hypothetical protein